MHERGTISREIKGSDKGSETIAPYQSRLVIVTDLLPTPTSIVSLNTITFNMTILPETYPTGASQVNFNYIKSTPFKYF
jgi:hypothetical protein